MAISYVFIWNVMYFISFHTVKCHVFQDISWAWISWLFTWKPVMTWKHMKWWWKGMKLAATKTVPYMFWKRSVPISVHSFFWHFIPPDFILFRVFSMNTMNFTMNSTMKRHVFPATTKTEPIELPVVYTMVIERGVARDENSTLKSGAASSTGLHSFIIMSGRMQGRLLHKVQVTTIWTFTRNMHATKCKSRNPVRYGCQINP